MNITEKRLKELKTIYKDSFWIELSEDEILEVWIKLLTLIKNILPLNTEVIWK